MVTDKFIEWAMTFLDWLIALFEAFPDVPDGVSVVINLLLGFLRGGLCALNLFVDLDYLRVLMVLWLAIVSADKIYVIVMWVLRKIPVINIK